MFLALIYNAGRKKFAAEVSNQFLGHPRRKIVIPDRIRVVSGVMENDEFEEFTHLVCDSSLDESR